MAGISHSKALFGFEQISGYFLLQWGWKRLFIAFIAGALSALSQAPFHAFYLLFFTFPVLVWLIDGTIAEPAQTRFSRAWGSFKIGWWFAFGYFLAGMWWVGNALLVEAEDFAWALPLAILGLPALLAFFWAVAIAVARLLWSEDWRRITTIALAIGIAEFARGKLFTGLPWNAIGYAALPSTLTMQSASVIGVYAIGTLAVLVFSTPALFSSSSASKPRQLRTMLLVSLTLVSIHLCYGYVRLSDHPTAYVDGVRIRVVQPNIAQIDKWREDNRDKIIQQYLDLSRQKLPGSDAMPTHYVWPESAFPFLLTQNPQMLAAIGELLPDGAMLITGAARAEAAISGKTDARVFNSVYVINHKGEIIAATDKVHLVPFGEYLPFADLAQSFGLRELVYQKGGFTAGNQREILDAGAAGKFIALVCYEIIFPGQILSGKEKERAGWMVNVTNDAWFGQTPGPYQHHHQALVRSVEEGLALVRSANSGISSISDPYGRIITISELGESAVIESLLPQPSAKTIYSIFGSIFFWLINAIIFMAAIIRPKH